MTVVGGFCSGRPIVIAAQFKIPKHGNLEHWARQGVFMLNTVLTVVSGNANSHQKHGWEEFTGAVSPGKHASDQPGRGAGPPPPPPPHADLHHPACHCALVCPQVIRALAEQRRPIVFMLWGKPAQVGGVPGRVCVGVWGW